MVIPMRYTHFGSRRKKTGMGNL